MTLEGCTALSVEMKTKFRTPNSSARSATHLVPLTLFCTASPMLHSISGTCLWAAAWKTTSGRYSWKSCRIRARSVTLAMQVYSTVAVRMACKRRSILKMRFSPRPTSTSARGLKRSTWRQISEPMLPPAPVTMTTRPSRRLPIILVSNWTGARRSRSPISMSRMGMRWSPPRRSSRRRMIFRFRPAFSQSFIRFRSRDPGQAAGNHQDVGRLGAGGDFPHVFQLPQHRDLAQPRFLRVFRAEKAADAIGQLAGGLDLVGQHAVGMIGADQQGPAGIALVEHRPELLPVHPPASPQCPQHAMVQPQSRMGTVRGRTKKSLAQPGPKEQDQMVSEEVIDGDDAEHRQDRSADQGDQVGEGHVGPPAVIMAQEEEDRNLIATIQGRQAQNCAWRSGSPRSRIAAGRPARKPRRRRPGAPPPPPRSAGPPADGLADGAGGPSAPAAPRRGSGAPGPPDRSPGCGIPAFEPRREQSASSVSRSIGGGNQLPALSGFSTALDLLSHCWIRPAISLMRALEYNCPCRRTASARGL